MLPGDVHLRRRMSECHHDHWTAVPVRSTLPWRLSSMPETYALRMVRVQFVGALGWYRDTMRLRP